ncbi:SKP1-like protein 14 [Abrus precatorius]|uniref:SKP1-like protein n=1 Tax=Abrus precatorius TaxID=3816 RepID=A0A8B8KGR1_ABRPR|nr:SKP1-like protein 14 [Abrus precatorius]
MSEKGECSKQKMAEEKLKTYTLQSADNAIFEVDSLIVEQMQTVQSFVDDIEGDGTGIIIPLPNVCSQELAKIIEFCREHRRIPDDADRKRFDEQFVKALSSDELKLLFLAANYLNMKSFFDFLSQSIANLIENKSVEFVRKFFDIENDFTPEEEAKLRKAHAWAFEGIDED